MRPSKVAYLSWRAAGSGTWPIGFREADKRAYLATIRCSLRVFLFRFFQISQFMRSAMPNGLKVGSGRDLAPCKIGRRQDPVVKVVVARNDLEDSDRTFLAGELLADILGGARLRETAPTFARTPAK
jgi:hypothetical protein